MTSNRRIVWATDTHLDFAGLPKLQSFCASIREKKPDIVILTGDISNGQLIEAHLLALENELSPTPVFFVLGNHDYWQPEDGTMQGLRDRLTASRTYPEYEKGAPPPMPSGAFWLGSSGVVPIDGPDQSVGLVGHDGWWDGIYADMKTSKVWLNDYQNNPDLAHAYQSDGINGLIAKCRDLSRESAEYVEKHCVEAFEAGYITVFVATHVPPFKENSVYNGRQSDKDWMPHFSSWLMGDALRRVAAKYPDRQIITLCGHSHGSVSFQAAPNLKCVTGQAVYRHPEIASIFEIDDGE